MSNMPVLKHLVQQQKAGRAAAIASICSSHPLVIEAAIDQGVQDGSIVLIEATANQVNQYGGYTGLKPADFSRMVQRIATERGSADRATDPGRRPSRTAGLAERA